MTETVTSPVPAARPDPPGGAARGLASRTAEIAAWAALVAFALATAGAVDPAAGAAVAAFFIVQALWLPSPEGKGRGEGRGGSVLKWAVGAAIAACVVQLVPLPEVVRGVIAPGPARARADLHALGLEGAWAPITVDVGGTVAEAVLWAGAAAALVVLTRRERVPLGARVAVGALVVLHALAWVDWLAGVRVLPLTHIEDPWGVGQEHVRFSDFAGWLVNRNHWAALGLVLWPLPLLWAWAGTGILRRGVGVVAAIGVVGSIVSTRSRAGLGLLALQVLAGLVILGWRAGPRLRWGALAALAAGIAFAAGPIDAFLHRVSAADVTGRVDLYVATGRMAVDSPAVGWGMGTFQSAFPAYQPDGLLYKYSHAHCDPLEWIAGAGLLGLVLVAGLAARIFQGVRDRRSSLLSRALWGLSVAGGAAAACVDFPLEIPALRFVWLGVLFCGTTVPGTILPNPLGTGVTRSGAAAAGDSET